ncbi:tRNA (adenosine(37)-N6)-threonylcarbamoyltransferase complex dimerization subunit type 1 TsaB [Thiomicrorhabdus sediminis]|uniref:tRNA threonylcarbamoyladenosine biosynthesis protein TsaB n=1 Tax=Thiomicrorhabdus sediminis TaxID=2580412 RepID=A0A4P9K6U5_9GAMM|nr:tRNA (adenosine(37)-N6)-threonylcarbamoyltransferase complex dimerization subunit type 1 TsaB [Thiomicrorhabdus sediminis]QCU90180.1 tRNA (adenosine(37)-N6)-threonylcarbamoyltransferase complex dimerization subunit type 1 TsaB [Thiomicrorhabdus sediminis]
MNSNDLPTILAIETSTVACSVALLIGERSYCRHELLPQRHAQQVLFMVNDVIDEAGIDSTQIDYLAFGEGPGAFTGLRIAAGVVQGLALGWQKPVIAMSSLETMAQDYFQNNVLDSTDKDSQTWSAVLDARMNEIYLLQGLYGRENGVQVTEEVRLMDENSVAEAIAASDVMFGDIDQAYPELVEQFSARADYHKLLPNALYMAQLARGSQDRAALLDDKVPQPLYLRNNVAETIEQRKQKQQKS